MRLFSTNEEHFNPSRSSAAQNPVPIDFPGTVEVRLNNVIVTANLKGIKKQIGTAAPADLSSVKAGGGALALSLGPNQVNRIEINYSNTDKVRPTPLVVNADARCRSISSSSILSR